MTMELKRVQQVFDESGIEWVDQHDKPLIPVVEQLSDGIFVGFYYDPQSEWVDGERLGDTPGEAFGRARELCASDVTIVLCREAAEWGRQDE